MVANYNSIMTENDTEQSPDTDPSPEENNEQEKKTTTSKAALIVVLSFVNFCYGVGLSLHGPLFPQLAREKELHPWFYSLVFGAYYLTFLIFIPVGGITLQRIKCKIVLFTGTFVVGSCALLFGSLQWCPIGLYFPTLAVFIRLVEGFGAASLRVSSYAMVATRFPSEIWKFSMKLESSFSLGLILGPIVGTTIYEIYGFSIPFYGSGVLTLIAAVCAISILRDYDETNSTLSWNFLSLLTYPSALICSFCIFATSFYTGFLQATLELFLDQFHLSGTILGLFFSISVITHCITTTGWKWVNEKGFNGVLLIFICSLLVAGSMVLIGPISFLRMDTSLNFVIGALILKGLGEGGQLICSFTLIFNDVIIKGHANSISTHCTLLVMIACCMTLGALLGSSLSGIIYETLAFQKGTLILLALEVLPLPCLFIYAFKRNYRRLVPLASPDETTSILQRTENS